MLEAIDADGIGAAQGDPLRDGVVVFVEADCPTCLLTIARLAQAGIDVSPADPHSLRFVTHRHVGNNEVDQAIAAFAATFSRS